MNDVRGMLSVFPETLVAQIDDDSVGYPVRIATPFDNDLTVSMRLTIEQTRTLWTELGAALQSLEELPAPRHAVGS